MNNFEEYKNYAVEDWFENPDFIRWVKCPGENRNADFEQLLQLNDEATSTLQEAIFIAQNLINSKRDLSDIERSRMWQNILQETVHKRSVITRRSWFKVASVASVILLCAAASFLLIVRGGDSLQHFAQYLSVDSLQDIQLVMPDKKQVALANLSEVRLNRDGQVEIELPKGDRVVMQTEDESTNVYQLIVPGGKRAYLVLNDGTRVCIHPGSKVVFPNKFDQKQRKVYLEGEAFLNVTKNPLKPFFVQTKQMLVSVLGTSFNVMAYPKQGVQSVVLVSGHVKVKSDDGEERHIEPNQCYTFDKNALADKIETVSTDEYTSWKDGVLNFSSEPLSHILQKVGNYYNVEMQYNASAVNAIKLSGKLDLNNTVDNALKVLATVAPIKIEHAQSLYVINVKP